MTKLIPALTVKQWLPEWDEIEFSSKNYRSKPPEEFLLLSLDAYELRKLSGIQRCTTQEGVSRSEDLGIQRRHDQDRSKEIARYIRHGFPWSSLTEQQRNTKDFTDLKMPGWLPTAVVVNILKAKSPRTRESIDKQDRTHVHLNEDGIAQVEIPDTRDSEWNLSGLPPIEIIDGQHRLSSFDEGEDEFPGYELPVVAFVDLGRSW